MVRLLLVLMAAWTLVACQRGPDAEVLRQHVETRLNEALPAGKLSLQQLERRGSQSDSKAPEGEARRIVYYDAVLKLASDYDFGAWDGPGVSGLVSALGAGPKGITGIRSGGNKTGDTLQVRGTALYREDSGGWTAVAAGGYSPVVAPSYASNAPTGMAAILDALRKVTESVPLDAAPAQREAIAEELLAAHAAIRSRLARINDGYGIAAGPEHGQYLRFVQALSRSDHIRTVALITRGGEENLRLLRAGKVSLALAQADIALDAYEGRGSFAGEGQYTSLRAIGSLYPEPVHVLVLANSKLASVTELKGRRVAIGEQGSASRTTALRVLSAHGLAAQDIVAAEIPLGEALARLRRSELDAVIQVIGVPADSVRDAIAGVPLRLLPLSQQAVEELTARHPAYFRHPIVRGSYEAQKEDVQTIATSALLLAADELSETEVTRLTRFVYGPGQDFLARGSAQAAQVSIQNARNGLPIPLHVGADKAFQAFDMQ